MNSLDIPQILYQPFAATGDKNTILDSPSTTDPQRANLQTGFPPITQIPIDNGGIPPERMDFNGLGYLLSSFYFFTQCGGVYTFNQDVSNAIGGYPLGAVLHYTDSNGTTYKVRSLLENNTYNFVTTPSYIDDEHWAYVSSTPITQDTSSNMTSNTFSTAAAQSLLNTVVHKTGNETISGNKGFAGLSTFTNYAAFWKTPYNIIVRSTSIENGVTPSSNQFMGIEFRDKNDVRVGWIGLAKLTDGTQRIELQKQGSTSCFTAPASDESKSIVTTEAMLKANDDTLDNCVKLGNGLLIQWGHIQQNSQQLNVTFHIPFKNTAYRMFTQDAGQLSGYSYAGVTGVTRRTTGATLYSYYANRYYDWLAIGFWY